MVPDGDGHPWQSITEASLSKNDAIYYMFMVKVIEASSVTSSVWLQDIYMINCDFENRVADEDGLSWDSDINISEKHVESKRHVYASQLAIPN